MCVCVCVAACLFAGGGVRDLFGFGTKLLAWVENSSLGVDLWRHPKPSIYD